MTKQEFEKRIGAEISQKDYSIVEHVYTWHPSISEVEGKKQIAELYKSFAPGGDAVLADVYRRVRGTRSWHPVVKELKKILDERGGEAV